MSKPGQDIRKAVHDLLASREVMEGNIELFHGGRRSAYRVVAVELRKLFCDGKNSLVPRLFPGAKLHPHMSYRPGMDTTNLLVQVVGEWEVRDGNVNLKRVFEKRAEPLSIDEWLEQPLLSGEVTLRNFIRSVSDKEGAHSDPVYNASLLLAKSVRIGPEEMLARLVVGIGEYIVEVLSMAVEQIPVELRTGYARG